MIGHLAVGVHQPVEPIGDIGEYLNKRLTIFVVLVDRFLAIAAGGDVIQRTGEF